MQHHFNRGRCQSMLNSTNDDAEIEKELAELSKSPIKQLRDRWLVLFRAAQPPAFGPDLLRRGIAQRIQEQRYGGLSAPVLRQLNQVMKAMADNPSGRIELPRRIKAGAVLVRTWKDKSYRATVLDNGFSFEGRTYPSLSEIAREITGTRWNGPRFFGLRTKSPTANGTTSVDSAPRPRGRPRAVVNDLFNSKGSGS